MKQNPITQEENTDAKVTIEDQLRLAAIMNDTPRVLRLGGKEFKITALKPGAQWLIAEESCKITKAGEDFTDLIRHFAESVGSVIRCLAFAILNDKDKINGPEMNEMCEFIRWETRPSEWIPALLEVMQMLSLDFFTVASSQIDSFREMTTQRKQSLQRQLSKQ
jgi:hypothetical protein